MTPFGGREQDRNALEDLNELKIRGNKTFRQVVADGSEDLHELSVWERLVNIREYVPPLPLLTEGRSSIRSDITAGRYFPVRMKWRDNLYHRSQVRRRPSGIARRDCCYKGDLGAAAVQVQDA